MNEQQLRHVIRQVIRETADPTLLREENTLYKAFVEPFVDVAKAVKLTSQDVLNTFKLVFKTLITISPEKLVEAREDYEDVKQDLDREWEPILESARGAIEKSDFGIAAFAMAPNLFFGYKIGEFALNAPSTVAEYFEEAGFDVPLKKFIDTTTSEEDVERRFSREEISSRRDERDDDGVLDKLRIFFFGESIARKDNLINEEKDEEKDKDKGRKSKTKLSSKNIEKEIEKYFKEMGMDKTLNSLGEKMLAAKKKQADALKAAAGQQIEALKSFSQAESIEQFDAAVKAAAKSGADVAAVQQKIDQLKKDLEKKVQDLQKDDKFKQSIKKQAGGKEVSDDQIADAAKKSANDVANQAIAEMKKEISSSLQKAMGEMKKQILDELSEGLPPANDPLYSKVMSTPMGKKLKAILDDSVIGLGT